MEKMNRTILLHLSIVMLFAIVEGGEMNCSVSRCTNNGGGPNIHFPFWLKHNKTADDCAYPPGFQLSCGGTHNQDTFIAFQHLVNTSIEGLQLSFNYKAIVRYINYVHEYIYLYDTPYLTDIVPTTVLNSSSTPNIIPFNFQNYYYPYYYNDRPVCYHLSFHDTFFTCKGYDKIIRDYTFFNCSSSAMIELSPSEKHIIQFLSTTDFEVYAYPSDDYTIDMLQIIRSCTKMYNFSSKLPSYLQSLPGRQMYWRLSLSTPTGGVKCEAVRKNCKFNDTTSSDSNPTYFQQPGGGGSDVAKIKRLVAVISPCIFLVVLGLVFLYNFIRLDKQKKENNELKIKMFMENYKTLKPTRYSYSDIKKITNMFKHKLGQGGYGTVFKGQISSDILVAVKVLHSDPKANGDDFINEVGTIGKIHHVNVVRLLGYCADGCNRALVYEFQPNHSLEKFVYKREKQHSFIGWQKMQQIALGIAKGIEYLHQGCAQQILHFDIKPNNILLDRNFIPKISDFGLAKLCNKGQSIVSMTAARGTIGYIAPEVFSRNFGKVSSKSDVYSFGMLLLEMVGGKNNDFDGEQNTSEVYFPEWIFHRLEKGGELVIQIENEDDSKIARKLTIVGLWCIGWHPIDRPSMKLVIQMLKGNECPAMPPNPFSTSTSGNATLAKSVFGERLEVISESE